MEKRSHKKVRAAPAVVKATTALKKVRRESEDGLKDHNKDVTEKEQSDTMEMMKALTEEEVDLLSSSGCSNNEVAAAVKTGSGKAEAESSSSVDVSSPVDVSSSDDEPAKKKAKEDTKNPKEESTSDDSSEESDEKVSARGIFGRGRGLFVGGRLRGGRCGGLGRCMMLC